MVDLRGGHLSDYDLRRGAAVVHPARWLIGLVRPMGLVAGDLTWAEVEGAEGRSGEVYGPSIQTVQH